VSYATEEYRKDFQFIAKNPLYAERAILMKHINKAHITFVANKHGVVINWTVFNS
jgi:hypothetical protein